MTLIRLVMETSVNPLQDICSSLEVELFLSAIKNKAGLSCPL